MKLFNLKESIPLLDIDCFVGVVNADSELFNVAKGDFVCVVVKDDFVGVVVNIGDLSWRSGLVWCSKFVVIVDEAGEAKTI